MVMRIAGLATGMDIDQIVRDLMRAERIPMDKLFQKREWLNWQREAYREINLALRNFRDTYSNMRLQSTFIGLKATSSNELGLKVSAGASAIAGTYQVKVNQLASGAQVPTGKILVGEDENTPATANTKIFEAMGRGSDQGDLKIKVAVVNEKDNSVREATLTITAQDTFASLAQKLARATDGEGKSLGIQASFDDKLGSFFITTRETGEHMGLKISAADDENNGFEPGTGVGSFQHFLTKYLLGVDEAELEQLANPEDHQTAPSVIIERDGQEIQGVLFKGQNAKFTFDGIEVEHATNTVTVRGLTLNLLQASGDEVYTISVQSNPDEVFNKIKAFVDAYNELVDKLNGKLNEPRYRDYPPLTDEQREALSEKEIERWEERAKSGLLRNDALLRDVLYSLRQAFTNPVDGIPQGQLRHLSEIGITTTPNWRDGGKLMIDETKLRQAIEERPDEVMALFTQAPAEENNQNQMGIGRRVYELLGTAMSRITERAGTAGVTIADQSVLGKQIKSLDQQLDRWEDRLAKIEERYWRQFTAMEKAVQQMNEQSNMLYSYFFSMMGTGGR